MEEKKVIIRVKNQCGTNRGYPIGLNAEDFAVLIRPRKTFNTEEAEAIQRLGDRLGFELEVETVKMVEEVEGK